mmetsp:Transcript_83739/g.215618  ORF Transcript_83739/g.215618 Transcript_83739/m.215618 type:complete len:349 (+) Transcript_83739:783-1829(+)
MEGIPGVAGEDASVAAAGLAVQLDLIRVRQVGHEAVEAVAGHRLTRRRRGHGVLVAAAALDGALPAARHGDVLRDPRGLHLGLDAPCEVLILHGTDEAHVAAEVGARLACPAAASIPLGALTELIARPALGLVGFGVASLPARGIGRVLLEARHAIATERGAAALRLAAVVARRGAGVRLAVRAKLLAGPLHRLERTARVVGALLLALVRARLARLHTLGPRVGLLEALEALVAARLAALRAQAARARRGALRVVRRLLGQRHGHLGLARHVGGAGGSAPADNDANDSQHGKRRARHGPAAHGPLGLRLLRRQQQLRLGQRHHLLHIVGLDDGPLGVRLDESEHGSRL